MSDWKTIETAPKDGRHVLVVDRFKDMTVAYWHSGSAGCWQLSQTGTYAGDGDLSSDPTHWMPLPEPPK